MFKTEVFDLDSNFCSNADAIDTIWHELSISNVMKKTPSALNTVQKNTEKIQFLQDSSSLCSVYFSPVEQMVEELAES